MGDFIFTFYYSTIQVFMYGVGGRIEKTSWDRARPSSHYFHEKLKLFFQRSRRCRPLTKSHIFLLFFLIFFRGPLLNWLGKIMLYYHWSTQTWCSKQYQPLTKLCCVHLRLWSLRWDFEHSTNEDVLWLSATLTACDFNLNYFRQFCVESIIDDQVG